MIWIDSSFAVEWLLGTERPKGVDFQGEELAVLPMQYTETFVYFMKQGVDPLVISQQLVALELRNPEKVDLQKAAFLYLEAREKKSKASLADALLAAVAQRHQEKIVAFDDDFADLGMIKKGHYWIPKREM